MKSHVAVHFASVCVMALAAGCVQPVTDRPGNDVPPALQTPAGQTLLLQARGHGVQIYACRAAGTGFAWALKAPVADLLNGRGEKIGKHYAGPTWEGDDDSKVVGALKASSDSPTPGNIPWVLLSAKSNAGSGIFSSVQSVQRLHTIGGVAPAEGCDAAHAGAEVRVPYKADYYFYGAGA